MVSSTVSGPASAAWLLATPNTSKPAPASNSADAGSASRANSPRTCDRSVSGDSRLASAQSASTRTGRSPSNTVDGSPATTGATFRPNITSPTNTSRAVVPSPSAAVAGGSVGGTSADPVGGAGGVVSPDPADAHEATNAHATIDHGRDPTPLSVRRPPRSGSESNYPPEPSDRAALSAHSTARPAPIVSRHVVRHRRPHGEPQSPQAAIPLLHVWRAETALPVLLRAPPGGRQPDRSADTRRQIHESAARPRAEAA